MQKDSASDVREIEREFLVLLNQLRAIHGYSELSELPEPPFCSFCGRSKQEMGALVEGRDAHICIDCAAEARRVLLAG